MRNLRTSGYIEAFFCDFRVSMAVMQCRAAETMRIVFLITVVFLATGTGTIYYCTNHVQQTSLSVAALVRSVSECRGPSGAEAVQRADQLQRLHRSVIQLLLVHQIQCKLRIKISVEKYASFSYS